MGQAIRRLLEASALRRRAPGPPQSAAGTGAPERESVGGWLGGQRRLRGLSLDDVAELTRIPRRSLERLEAGAFDGSADGFARGFVRTVAEAIGVDPEEATARLLGEARPERARRAPPWRTVALALLAAGLALASVRGVSSWLGAFAPSARPVRPAEPTRVRRDHVRELAARTPPAREPGAEPSPPAGEAAPLPGAASPR